MGRHRILRIFAAGSLVLLFAGGLCLIPERPLPRLPLAHPVAASVPAEVYLQRQLQRSRAQGVPPANEERLSPRSPARAKVVFLYVHGFGASRAEGEAVVDKLAAEFAATVYYTRLPGHGGDLEAQAAATVPEYFARLEEDFHHIRPLGDQLVLIGSSTGALLCAWLAARHPDDVAALVLASPLFAFADPTSFLLSRRAGLTIIETLYGKFRDATWHSDPEGRKQPGYEEHWLTKQRFRALGPLDDLRRTVATDSVMSAIRAPVLLLYYYADADRKDPVVSVPAMLAFVDKANGGHPHPLSRKVAIADGNHILLSAYVRTDKEKILTESRKFLSDALQLPVQ